MGDADDERLQQSDLQAFLSQLSLLDCYDGLVALGAFRLTELADLDEADCVELGAELDAWRLLREVEAHVSVEL